MTAAPQKAARKPRPPILVMEAVEDALTFLQQNYGRPPTYVLARDVGKMLPVLRTLEVIGFVKIKRLAGDKRWIATPAGALWLHMHNTAHKETFDLDREVLADPFFGWMSLVDACTAAETLTKRGYATATNKQGAPAEFFHLDSVILTPLRSVVPGSVAYPRFYKQPSLEDQYG